MSSEQRCTICNRSTDFICHAPNLCLECGDALQGNPDAAKAVANLISNLRAEGVRLVEKNMQIRQAAGDFQRVMRTTLGGDAWECVCGAECYEGSPEEHEPGCEYAALTVALAQSAPGNKVQSHT